MSGSITKVLLVFLLVGFFFQSAHAYTVPPRKIEVKPYLNLLVANSFWQQGTQGNAVEDKTGVGFGLKLRTQVKNSFGLVINSSYSKVEAIDSDADESVVLAIGGYYSRTADLGTFNLDCTFGMITSADQALGLFMPSLEYNRPMSDRVSLALEFGWPIANDWLRDFDFVENYSSFTLSLGAVVVF